MFNTWNVLLTLLDSESFNKPKVYGLVALLVYLYSVIRYAGPSLSCHYWLSRSIKFGFLFTRSALCLIVVVVVINITVNGHFPIYLGLAFLFLSFYSVLSKTLFFCPSCPFFSNGIYHVLYLLDPSLQRFTLLLVPTSCNLQILCVGAVSRRLWICPNYFRCLFFSFLIPSINVTPLIHLNMHISIILFSTYLFLNAQNSTL